MNFSEIEKKEIRSILVNVPQTDVQLAFEINFDQQVLVFEQLQNLAPVGENQKANGESLKVPKWSFTILSSNFGTK